MKMKILVDFVGSVCLKGEKKINIVSYSEVVEN